MNAGPPPSDHAIGWYRRMLWMMPTCIAITSVYGLVVPAVLFVIVHVTVLVNSC